MTKEIKPDTASNGGPTNGHPANGTTANNAPASPATTAPAHVAASAPSQELPDNTASSIAVYEEKLQAISGVLIDLAESIDDETLQNKVMALAEQASPAIRGIDGPGEAKVPDLRLMQAMTSQDAVPVETRAGNMYTTSGVHIGDHLKILPIYTHLMRKKWAVGGNAGVECESLDAVTGTRYGACAQCPYGQFQQGMRPECSAGYAYFAATADLDSIFRVEFLKTNAPAGRKIRTLAQQPALWSRVFELHIEKKQQQSGAKATYYVFNVRVGEKTSDQTRKICDTLCDYFEANHKKAVILQNAHSQRQLETGGPPAGALNGTPETAPNTDALDFSTEI